MMPVDLPLHYLRRGQGDLALEHGRQPARLPLDQRDRRPDRLDEAGEEQAGPVRWQHAAVKPNLPVVLDSEDLRRKKWEFRLVARGIDDGVVAIGTAIIEQHLLTEKLGDVRPDADPAMAEIGEHLLAERRMLTP